MVLKRMPTNPVVEPVGCGSEIAHGPLRRLRGQKPRRPPLDQACQPGAQLSASRIAASKEGVPAMFGDVVSLDLINAFATNRTKPNMNPPTAVPYITEAGT
jgi:hypothetical protein